MFVRKSTYYKLLDESNDIIENLDFALQVEAEARLKLADMTIKYSKALDYIIEQETVAPNATVTRMVNAAKEALGE